MFFVSFCLSLHKEFFVLFCFVSTYVKITVVHILSPNNPTPTPTIYATPIPTFNPTLIPTFNPTPIPAFNPTPIPTFNPTLIIPTINPTLNNTYNLSNTKQYLQFIQH